MSKKTEYTVGLGLPGGNLDDHLHMTIAFLGEATPETLDKVKEALMPLRSHFPIKGTYGDCALFGPHNNIPVRLINIDDPIVNAILQTVDDKFGIVEPGMKDRPERRNFHVTMKKSEKEIIAATGFLAERIFIKQLGSHAPCFVLKKDQSG